MRVKALPRAVHSPNSARAGGHTCGLKSDGSVICWGAGKTNTGNYEYGQSIVPSGMFTQLRAGWFHTCGLKNDGSAICWGAGKTNTGSWPEYGQSIVPSGTFIQLSAGYGHTCGLKSDGSTTCWGDNRSGQTAVPSSTFTQLGVGDGHTCGLKSDGSATCWGNNTYGQSTAPSGTFIQISSDDLHTCGLKSDGSAICWGLNSNGQTTVPSGTFTQLSAGSWHTCGLKGDGSAICWGSNTYGQTNVPVDSTSPTASGKINGISTRAPVGTTAEKYMMAGVYVRGTTQKQALVRATGKGLMKQGVNTTLNANLEVYQLATSTSVPVDKNDDWKNHSSYSTVQAAGGMSDNNDAALVTNLNLGYYSMVVMPSGGSMTSGGGSSQGIGLIEVYDNDHSSTSRLSGISTRSYVGSSAADYMYAGLAIQGDVKLLIRGLGKGLIAQGVTGALDDAMITVRNGNGTVVNSNDNWQTHSSSSTLTQRGQAPKDSSDAAMIINLSDGLYTIEVKSAKGGQGVALVEVYEIVD